MLRACLVLALKGRTPHPPYKAIKANQSKFIDPEHLPRNFQLLIPRDMRQEQVILFFEHIIARQQTFDLPNVFCFKTATVGRKGDRTLDESDSAPGVDADPDPSADDDPRDRSADSNECADRSTHDKHNKVSSHKKCGDRKRQTNHKKPADRNNDADRNEDADRNNDADHEIHADRQTRDHGRSLLSPWYSGWNPPESSQFREFRGMKIWQWGQPNWDFHSRNGNRNWHIPGMGFPELGGTESNGMNNYILSKLI